MRTSPQIKNLVNLFWFFVTIAPMADQNENSQDELSDLEVQAVLRAIRDVRNGSGYGFVVVRVWASEITDVDISYNRRMKKNEAHKTKKAPE